MSESNLMLDVGQANELKLSFRKYGWTNAQIKKLCESDIFSKLIPVVDGRAEITITIIKHIIDCDADPFIPGGLDLVSHKKNGKFIWDPARISLYLSDAQKFEKYDSGTELHKQLSSQQIVNANMIDYLLANPIIIPEKWKNFGTITFWGTIYEDNFYRLRVRNLFWGGKGYGKWCSGSQLLKEFWFKSHPAALFID